MTAQPRRWSLANAAWDDAAPTLSILTPFKGDDPTALIAALAVADQRAELIVLDDGGGDDRLADRVGEAVMAAHAPARFIRLASNVGRARARNLLASEARGRHLLFIDADMAPDRDDFLARWLKFADDSDAAVAFGGLTLKRTPRRRETAAHRAMALKGDCLSADARRRRSEKHVFTSNLLVRSDVFAAFRFDEGFEGWGWEDVEWAMRVGRAHPITHFDNTASHLGLDTAADLIAKFEQSAANFARAAGRHGDLMGSYASYRAARAIAHLPCRGLLRGGARAVALFTPAPARARALALRIYRAALYAEVIGRPLRISAEP